MPTNIAAPRECRDGRLEHVELLPSENEINIAEDLWAWLTSAWQAKPDAERIVKAIGVPNDLLATARFGSMSFVPCLPAEHDIPESALFLGRSVQVRVGGLARVVTA
ncbi:MAG: hypothetical protein ACK5Y8_16985 [Betaproteobacteria bacterium]